MKVNDDLFDDLSTISSPLHVHDQDRNWEFVIGTPQIDKNAFSNADNNLLKFSDIDSFSFPTDNEKSSTISSSNSTKFSSIKLKKLPGKIFKPFVSLEVEEMTVHQLRSELFMAKYNLK